MSDLKNKIKAKIAKLEESRDLHDTSDIDVKINLHQEELNRLNQERSTRQESQRQYDERIKEYTKLLMIIEDIETDVEVNEEKQGGSQDEH